MASKTYGNMGEFNQATENWAAYMERMEQYFLANEVTTTNKKLAISLSMCGPTTYNLSWSLVALSKVTDIVYGTLLEKINKHFIPRPSIIWNDTNFTPEYSSPESQSPRL